MVARMTLPRWVDDAIEAIDAGIFSGDTFHNTEAIAELREQMARWERGLKEHEASLRDELEHPE